MKKIFLFWKQHNYFNRKKIRLQYICYLFLLFFTCQSFANSHYKQNGFATINAENVTLETVFKELESTTPYRFLYLVEHINLQRKVTINYKNTSIRKVLEKLFRNTDVTFLIKKKQIILKKEVSTKNDIKTPNPNNSTKKIQRNIIGFVYDEFNVPLSGVDIFVKGTTGRGISSNFDGNYEIAVSKGEVLSFSFLGYETQDVTISDELQYNVTMVPSILALDTVNIVSTGYQEIFKERATGSYEKITKEVIETKISQNFFDKIAGEFSGLVPGGTSEIGGSIRGANVFNAGGSQTPLIVVDGIPIETDFNTINPNDVESVTILKDAAASSIWGIRAANGVIVIVTKKGSKSKVPTVNFSTNIAITDQPDLFEAPYANTASQIEYQRELVDRGFFATDELFNGSVSQLNIQQLPPAVEVMLLQQNGDITQQEANARLAQLSQLDVRREFSDLILRPQVWNQYNLDVSGGGKNNTYRASLTYNNNEGEQIRTGADQVILNLANSFDLTSKFKVNTSLNISRQKSQLEPNETSDFFNPTFGGISRTNYQNIFNNYSFASSILDNEGNYVASELGANGSASQFLQQNSGYALPWTHNIKQEFDNADNTLDNTAIRAQAGFEYELAKQLTANVTYQYESNQGELRNYYNENTYAARTRINSFTQIDGDGNTTSFPIPVGGILDLQNSKSIAQTIRAQLNYNGDFKDNLHRINAVAGYEARKITSEANRSRQYGFNEQGLTSISPDFVSFFPSPLSSPNEFYNGLIPANNSPFEIEDRFLSYYTNGAYTFNNKYTVSASARLDDTNSFARNNSQRNIPTYSFGAQWNLANEFFKESESVNRLNLKATYGINGNVNFVTTPSITTRIGIGNQPFNNVGSFINSLPNPDLRLERTGVLNIRTEFALFKNLISGSAEYYSKESVDVLSETQVNSTLGASLLQINNGSITNKGIEVTLKLRPFRKGAFKYTTTGILGINKSEITNVETDNPTIDELTSGRANVIGNPLLTLYAYDFAGLDRNGNPQFFNENGDIVDVDTAIDNPNALVEVGTLLPTHYGSWINEFEYKRLSLRVLTTFSAGHVFNNRINNFRPFNFGNSNITSDFTNRWQNPGDENFTSVPAIPVSRAERFREGYIHYEDSDIFYDDASVIRLRQINLNYNIPIEVTNRAVLKGLTIGFQAENLAFKSFNKWGVDPENTTFPVRSIYTLNVSAKF